MSKRQNITKNKGLTMALVVLWLGLGFVNSLTLPDSLIIPSDKTEQSSEKENNRGNSLIIKVTEAVQTTISINLDFQSFLLEEIETEEEDEKDIPLQEKIFRNISKESQILLRKIISRNAP